MRARVFVLAFVFLCAVLAASHASAKVVTVKSYKVPVRSGPGWYYNVVHEAMKGDKLEILATAGKWYKVKLPDGKVGYASVRSVGRSVTGRKPGKRTTSSRPMMVAAIRGVADMGVFPRKYAEKHGLDPEALGRLMEQPFSPEEYKYFKKPLKAGEGIDVSTEPLPASDRDVGAAIAMRLISVMPPSKDQRLRKYVSMVGTSVLEQTPEHDVPFVFVVLESPRINSFSAPGGFVFITTGALELIGSEAELAGVLSHEVVHVLKRHGMEELDRQGARIRGQGMMDELDSELETRGMDNSMKDVAEDLEDMADQIFEQLIGGRKMSDEDESDALGTRLLSSTGYAGGGLRDFILKSEGAVTGEETRTYAYRDAKRRAEAIDSLIKREGLSGTGEVLKDRYGNYAR
jgi:uncharacterized protein YraI